MSAAAPAGKSAGQKSSKSTSNKPGKHQRSNPSSKKHRWTAAERAAKGRKPRRRGGADEVGSGRALEYAAPRNREERRAAERAENFRTQRDDRRSYDRGDRTRYERDDRPRFNRDDRDRNDRARYDRDDRRSFGRDERRPFNRDDRARNDRDDRRWNRDDRPYNRDDRGGNDRDDRRSFQRDDRRPYDRDDRRSFQRDDRRPYDRDDRNRRNSRSNSRDDRTYDRDNRRSFDRSDRDRSERARFDDRRTNQRNDRDRLERSDRGSYAGDRRSFDRTDRVRSDQDRQTDDRTRRTPVEPTLASQAPAATEAPAPDAATSLTTADAVGFAELGVAQPLVDRLGADGIVAAFPIQAASIPDAVAGRDVLGRGRTGSGKTLGFGLPMLTRLAAGERPGRDPRGLILLPTRELATQVSDVLAPLARTVGLRTQLVAGGMSYGPQLNGLDKGVDIVIGTPGRLIDLMDRAALLLGSVEITVLDEADHMADLGFLPDVTTLLDAVPADGQRMLFSATLDRGIDRLVERYLSDPSTHEVDSAQASVDTMAHYLLPVAPADKRPITAEIANRDGRTVIFVRTQLGADRVAEQLRDAGVMAGALHGGLPQGARNRTLEAFKTGSLPVLVATDVAARGIHVDEVGLVLQVDPPTDSKTYLHRAGRTARAGQTGVVVTLVLPNQRGQVRRLAKDAGVAATQLDARPGDAALGEATGAVPTDGPRIGERDYAKLIAPRQPVRSGRGPRRGPGRGPRDDRRSRDDRYGPRSDRGRRNGSGRREQAAYHSGR
ncbi:DEAD/DEAH box helicase [Microlunatus elymi]|uniref:DEAD/DEAH box helicase n=1 Tax=Microlunatus elymi TaxID=2596828 RepID=A0A516PWN2_9ACTN|nr:DEAD/DEAH box helicase [Microlunatus elymi]QDP95597.1 DEAD/DEAH box helicase [Microlunatus elymi]